jgi:diguanylate cyclase (GGDEF)-like protein
VRERLASVFAKSDDPYAGIDRVNAARFGGAIWYFGAVVTALVLPFAHPTHGIGSAGWLVAAAVIVAAVLAGTRMRNSGAHASHNEVLAYSYGGLACIAIIVWLTGGLASPYDQLYLTSAVYTAAVHPPRRAVAFLGVLSLVVLLPLVYDAPSPRDDVVDLVTALIVWLALSLVVLFLMVYVRAQRVGLRREGEDARRQARLDPLTGLPNRRAFDEDLQHAIWRAKAGGHTLSVVVCDLNDFKDFNDRYGHLEGDTVLKVVAESFRGALRGLDRAYRWGGDEFAVILPQADEVGAELVAERVRAAVAQNRGPNGDPLGMSTGVAELNPVEDTGPAALLAEADRALMSMKASGAL